MAPYDKISAMKKLTFFLAVLCLSVSAADLPRTKYVNLFVGTVGDGFTTPSASYPLGMLNPGPDTYGKKNTASGGYCYDDVHFAGFSQWHLNGTGHPALGDILIFPFCGEAKDWTDERLHTFSHTNEKAEPGYYALAAGGVESEMTASEHLAMYRWTRRGTKGLKVLVDLQYVLVRRAEEPVRAARVEMDAHEFFADKTGLAGMARHRSWEARSFAYAIQFDRPWTSVEKFEPVKEKGETAPRYVFAFDDVGVGESVQAKVAFSFTLNRDALKINMKEIPDWNFAAVRKAAHQAWEKILSKIDVETTEERKAKFYTALYHTFAHPNVMSDVGAAKRYTTFSLWDTFRALHPLYTILVPEVVPDILASFLDQYHKNGYLPVWTLANEEIDCMIANHSVPVIVDAWSKGLVPKAMVGELYEAVKRTLTNMNSQMNCASWPDLEKYGYITTNSAPREACSRTLEYAYDDWCAALFAEGLGHKEDAAFFRKRAQSWKNLIEPTMHFVNSRGADGKWREPFDPYHAGWGDGYDFTEGNSWQYSWHVFQDPEGLIWAMGGRGAFEKRLGQFFDPKHNRLGSGNLQWFTKDQIIGQYWHGNEPCHHIPWFWQYLERPERTTEIIREIDARFYLNRPDGLSGNDDCGQMSAWYVCAALGFYPFNPCASGYVWSTPLVEKARIILGNGNVLTIDATAVTSPGKFAAGVELNGKRIEGIHLTHSDLMGGGTLKFVP